MNNTIDIRFSNLPANYNRLTTAEIRELRAEGKHYFNLPHIPRGNREQAIFAVAQYLFGSGLGYGHEEERLEALRKWYFDRRSHRNPRAEERADACLRRSAFWTRRDRIASADENRNSDYSQLSERCIDRLIATRLNLGAFLQANINRMDRARAKIYQATLWLAQCGMRIGRKAIQRVSGCHKNTVNKHSDLWKSPFQGGGRRNIAEPESRISNFTDLTS